MEKAEAVDVDYQQFEGHAVRYEMLGKCVGIVAGGYLFRLPLNSENGGTMLTERSPASVCLNVRFEPRRLGPEFDPYPLRIDEGLEQCPLIRAMIDFLTANVTSDGVIPADRSLRIRFIPVVMDLDPAS